MSITLLGYMGLNLRNSAWLSIVILPIFIGAVIYTFYAWKKEDEQLIVKEITKAKEELLNIVRRLISDIHRVKQQQLALQLDQLRKHWHQQLDSLNRDYLQNQQKETEQENIKARARVNTLENQLREWQGYKLKVQQLQSAVNRLTQPVKDLVQQLAKH